RRARGSPVTDVLQPDAAGLASAAARLQAGALVAFPTDTVHGVACRAGDPEALSRLFELKGRPPERRVAWLIDDLERARQLGLAVDRRATELAARFWPGGLTIVLPRAGDGDPSVPQPSPTLGVRVPAHPIARALLARTGPLPTSSANRHGMPDCRSTDDILVAFAGADLLDAVLDGTSPGAAPSTVVELLSSGARVLREGAIPRAAIEAVLGSVD
ncbi:MAG: L-threonylcarbamoyladenylate synthase, partial [Chloroflexota bacterium]|nr:L-threonylcarbamoyladenylate synthase [Chloroflexota bacterium]